MGRGWVQAVRESRLRLEQLAEDEARICAEVGCAALASEEASICEEFRRVEASL